MLGRCLCFGVKIASNFCVCLLLRCLFWGMGDDGGEQRRQGESQSLAKFESIDDFFASFAYKGSKPRSELSSSSSSPPHPNPSEAQNPSTPSPTPPQQQQKKNRKRTKKSLSFQPSSYVRVVVNGESRVVSSYFPLPPNATQPVIIDRRHLGGASARKRKVDGNNNNSKKLRRRKNPPPDQQEEEEEGDIEEEDKKKKKEKRQKPRSILSANEKRLDAYRRVGEDNTWEAPPSEFNLLQERHSFDPWRVLVICMLLNLTTGRQVKRVLPGLFFKCPDAETAAKFPEEELEQMIQTLGLHKKRAKDIKRLSSAYLGSEWTHVTQLPGVGKYAADAYAIFCAGKPEEVTPEDHKLVDYWKFVCEKRSLERHQQSAEGGRDSV